MSRLIIGIAILALSAQVEAATINAASCSRADVGAAVNTAVDGDTVMIPAGTCTWTTNLTISDKFLTLQGAGIGQTVLVDGVSKANYPNIPQLLVWNTKAGGLTRLTGITFQGGTLTDDYNKGMIQIAGASHQLRIDQCKFIPTRTAALFLYGGLWGVIDHNIFDLSFGRFGLYIFHNSWNLPGSDFGDASWADDTNFGTEEAVFVEDNDFTNNLSGTQAYANDGWSGSRVVYRYNTYTNTTWANHGTESGGRWRSQRSYEVYNNTFVFTGVSFPSFIGARGGVGVVHNNTATVTGGPISRFADLQYYRATQSFNPWGQCTGGNVWDGNQSGGYPCLDQPGVGKGDLLSGFDPTPVGWPHQIAEPTYAWNNTINGSPSDMVSNVSVVVEGRDFFNSPRPGYTPFTYPHPLVTGAPPPPPPPPPPGTLDLSVSKSGAGTGTVTSSPAGINCGPDCFESYPGGTVVALTATPDSGSTFTGWGGACSGTSTCSVTGNTPVSISAAFAASGGSSITIGETSILSADDNGNGNLLLAQAATLSQAATIQSLSFYVTVASGTLQLGIYDATGPGGGPGAKKAETAAFTSVVGWNTAAVTAPVSLPPATYWLAYLPSSSALAFKKELTGSARYYPFTYGPVPATFSTSPTSEAVHWSLYATLTVDGSPPPPPPPPSPPTAPSGITTRRSAITVAWVDNSANETGFEVWRQVGSAAYALLATGAANATTHTDSNVATGLQHCYKVRAVNAAGVSAFTAQSCNTP